MTAKRGSSRSALLLAALGALVTLTAPRSEAVPFDFSPGQELFLGLDANTSDAYGLRYKDLSNLGGLLDVSFDPNPVIDPKVQPGFQLVDGSLRVLSTAAATPGRARVRYRMRFDARALGRAGIRANQLRLMRFDARADTWVRARRLIRDARARRRARFFFGRRARFELGSFGVDTQRSLVWGVMDVDGTYAIGASRAPEPSSLFLALTGLTALVGGQRWRSRWQRRQRRRDPS